MPLPDLIEIVPLTAPVHAEITVPGSKSITNRALILAALADGETTLQGALWSEDTQVMADCLQKLGFTVKVSPDPDESCNRTITVKGLGGKIPRGGTPKHPLELFVGNAGTAARFLSAFVCLGDGVYRLHGVPRMHERPQAALFKALRELGYRVDSPNDKLPAIIHGTGPRADRCTVSIEESSQFASGLLLCASVGGWEIKVTGENAEESPYVAMTLKLIEAFPKQGGIFRIEPDASSGSYFWAIDWLLWIQGTNDQMDEVIVKNWPNSGLQVDSNYTLYHSVTTPISRINHLGDSIMTRIVVAPFNRPAQTGQFVFVDPKTIGKAEVTQPMIFKDLGRLRDQETERVIALRDELRKCGVRVEERGNDLIVHAGIRAPKEPIETYNDHRMAMCFAILGLKIGGIKIRNPSCVKKTFPNFFQKIAADPKRGGLGVRILEAKTGAILTVDELFAE